MYNNVSSPAAARDAVEGLACCGFLSCLFLFAMDLLLLMGKGVGLWSEGDGIEMADASVFRTSSMSE